MLSAQCTCGEVHLAVPGLLGHDAPLSGGSPAALLSDLLWRLYASARGAGIGEFEHSFLALLKHHLPFDAAWTGRSTFVAAEPLLHHSCLDRLPPTYVEDWQAVRHCDPIALHGNERLGKAMVVSIDDPRLPQAFRQFGRRHGIAHMLNAASREGHDGLLTFVSVYRNDPMHPFTADEIALLEDVMRHVDLAVDVNRSHHLSRWRAGAGAWGAVCDHWGLLHQSGEGFHERLRLEWPEWQGAWLPQALVEHLQSRQLTPYLGQRVRVEVRGVACLLQLYVAERAPTDVLSGRERDVLHHYAEGRTYKEVARLMDIAPATVRHHLRNVHKKLGVTNKGQLLRVLQGAR